ncbi:hypothetical protein [Caldifermentibacillus hisashii]|uniref:hypothetical protein n=1 Tax=Caldifermentibacillus hisashii TaxID=996558 RepID=UPI001C104CA6|nr:hypothetical protein [Caldifermentibacillus hisashii]MBU5342304.1 hypothetical protein [Caldifermentibacillus hisashii]
MAYIKDGKLVDVVRGVSMSGTNLKLKARLVLGWEQMSEVKPNGDGYGCLITRDIKVRR